MNTNKTSAAAYLTILAGGHVPDFYMPVQTQLRGYRGYASAAASARDRRKPNTQRKLKGYRKR